MACTDVQTIQAGNGSKTQFSFDFPYIFKSEIHVYFWNVVTKEYDEKLTTDSTYPWTIANANPTIVEFTGTAPPSPAAPTDPGEPTVDNVKIRRITKVDDIRALFNPGSSIRSDDLNKNFEQLRYAIQEANCQGIPDDVDAYLKEYYWDRFDNTIYQADAWRSNDATIATTAALDQRFQDEVSETFTKAELAAANKQMPDNDTALPTTGALNDYINEVITNDIGTDGTGITVTDDGDGTITLGLADNTIDFDKIKDADQIKLADQVADYDVVGTDNNIFTAQAATRRFNNYYQNSAPSTTAGIGVGQVWVDPNDDLTLSVWSGTGWVGVTSGGTFTNQPKVVYVDSVSGDDSNDGHRISRPKKTIRAALADINGDANGDGSIVSVAPGIYAETLPLDIQKNDIGVIGQSLRTCIIHPKIPEADQAGYGVNTPHSQELQSMFRVNSGSYFKDLTLTGLKASGTRGASGSLYTDSTYGLPPNQGWNFSFYPNAVIKKSPYIQNCTNFSDSQINNVNFTPHTPGEGAAGDLDSAPTGGGILVDGSVPAANSPLRSIVCDSYTHTALDGPGLFVTNNGYTQCTSSYAFFNHAHITCINGGQANLAASTSDFGRFALIADGKSTTAIFTSNVDTAAADGSKTFHINAPTAGSGWHGSATRPQDNMLVTVNSVTYPVLSAVARTDSEGNAGWTVTISRPDPNDTASNLGLNGAVSDNAAVQFFLRSMIASSGHTMEYVGSGTDYTALPENGGVPIDANQVVERNNGKVWSAITDHKGKFSLGDFFTVDQQAKSVSVNPGSFQVDLSTLTVDAGGNAVFGAPLDMGNNQVTSTTGNLKLNASGSVDVQTNKIINVADPTAAQDAVTKNYIDNNFLSDVVNDLSPQLGANLDVNDKEIISTGNGNIILNPAGSGKVGIGTTPAVNLHVKNASSTGRIRIEGGGSSSAQLQFIAGGQTNPYVITQDTSRNLIFFDNATERMRIDSSGKVGIGATPGTQEQLLVHGGDNSIYVPIARSDTRWLTIHSGGTDPAIFTNVGAAIRFGHGINRNGFDTERMRIDSSGRVMIGLSTGGTSPLNIEGIEGTAQLRIGNTNGAASDGDFVAGIDFHIKDNNDATGATCTSIRSIADQNHTATAKGTALAFHTTADDTTTLSERLRIDSSGNVGIGTTSPTNSTNYVNLALSDSSGGIVTFMQGATQSADIIGGSGLYLRTLDASPITFRTNGSNERMRIDSSGNVGIGTTSPSQILELKAAEPRLCINGTTANAARGIEFEINGTRQGSLLHNAQTGETCLSSGDNGSGYFINFKTDNSERMRIDSSGNVLIGTTAVDTRGIRIYGDGLNGIWAKTVNTTNYWLTNDGQGTGAGTIATMYNDTTVCGSITVNSNTTAFNTGSDYRLKENIVDIIDGITRVKQLSPKRFNFIIDADTEVDGFIAHEAQTVVPEAVTGTKDEVDDDGNAVMQCIDQSKIVPLLTAALQEAIAKIETLETKVAALEAG